MFVHSYAFQTEKPVVWTAGKMSSNWSNDMVAETVQVWQSSVFKKQDQGPFNRDPGRPGETRDVHFSNHLVYIKLKYRISTDFFL